MSSQVTILNVDDTVAARYTKSRILRQAGYAVIEASNGAEALRVVREQLPDLVICDVNLGDMSGIDVCRQIKADPHTRSIPVVQISATFVTPHDQEVGLEGGAEIYLTEPLEPLELTTVVRVLLRLHSMELGLIQSEARWRSLVDSNVVGVAVWEKQHLLEANDEFLRIIGYTRTEALLPGLSWQAIAPLEIAQRSDNVLTELQEHGTCASFETQYVRRDGTHAWVLLGAAMILDGDQRWMSFTLDISDRKHADVEREAALRREREARAQAEQATRLKDEFLANLSHELRTPMNAIIGWTHLLRSGRLDDSQRQRALESIDRGARSQARLIEDLLDVSRIISGKLSLTLQPVSLEAVIESAVESERPAALAKGVCLVVHGLPAELTVLGDAGRLQQVLLNILANAVKFTPAGGRIDVSARRAGDVAEVSVADNGEGITAEFLPFVFDRFRQADGSRTRTHSGLGLGLEIARHVIELHGGSVHAASPGEGQGSTFTVTVPLATGVEGTPRRPIADKMPGDYGPPGGSGVRVLAVANDGEMREIIAAVLERGGFSFRTAKGAREALDLLDEWRPDVIVADIAVPGEDGYEFVRLLRARPADQGGRIPALALSAFARAEDRELALRCGCQAHIAKPVDPADLVRAIAEITARPAP